MSHTKFFSAVNIDSQVYAQGEGLVRLARNVIGVLRAINPDINISSDYEHINRLAYNITVCFSLNTLHLLRQELQNVCEEIRHYCEHNATNQDGIGKCDPDYVTETPDQLNDFSSFKELLECIDLVDGFASDTYNIFFELRNQGKRSLVFLKDEMFV